MEWISLFLNTFWDLTVEMAPYLLLGFLIAGLLNGVFSKDWLQRKLGKPGLWSSTKAALLGIPLPLCSCGVIPTGVSFHNQGASKGATTSFLISTPQTGVDSILITYALMGWAFAITRPIVALITGVFGGVWADFGSTYVPPKEPSQFNTNNQPKEHWFKRIFVYAFVTFLQDISRWLILGLVLATLITILVPDSWFTEYLDTPWINLFIVLLASVPLYVCATSSVPIAAALLLKGISPGAALVFLMAGPATNVATLTVLWQTIGKKTTIKYLLTIVFGAILSGLVIDYLLPSEWFLSKIPAHTNDPHAHHFLPQCLMIGSGILLLYLILQAELIRFIPKKPKQMKTTNKTTKTYKIDGMTCNHCVANVERNLTNLPDIEEVSVDLQKGTATVNGTASAATIEETVNSLGYQYKGEE